MFYDIHPTWYHYTQHTENKMTNKNPFEIRADMLKLAKDYMDQQYQMNVDFWKQQFETNKATAEEFQKAIQSYSMDDLMEKAKEMYSFVSDKK